MSPKAEIIPAEAYHCGRLIRRLRHEHAASFLRLGIDGHRELRSTMAMSTFRRALLLDGELAGMWGHVGSMAAPVGHIWCMFTQEATRYPILLVKHARLQLEEMMTSKQALTTNVLEGDETALRFVAFFGFCIDCRDPEGGVAYSARGRRNLVRYAKRHPDARIPMARGHVIRFVYPGEPDIVGEGAI